MTGPERSVNLDGELVAIRKGKASLMPIRLKEENDGKQEAKNDTEMQYSHRRIIGRVGIRPTVAVSLGLPADPSE
jgi:hypothetical protein